MKVVLKSQVVYSNRGKHHKHRWFIYIGAKTPMTKNLMIITQRCENGRCKAERTYVMVMPGGNN